MNDALVSDLREALKRPPDQLETCDGVIITRMYKPPITEKRHLAAENRLSNSRQNSDERRTGQETLHSKLCSLAGEPCPSSPGPGAGRPQCWPEQEDGIETALALIGEPCHEALEVEVVRREQPTITLSSPACVIIRAIGKSSSDRLRSLIYFPGAIK